MFLLTHHHQNDSIQTRFVPHTKEDTMSTANSLAGAGMYLALSTQTEGRYSVIKMTTPPGGGPPPHTHLNEDEGFLVLSGTFTVYVGDKKFKLGPLEHAFGPRGVEHYFRNTGHTMGEILFIYTPGGYENYFRELTEVRNMNPPDLLIQEEAIDRKYGTIINRRQPNAKPSA